VLEHYLEKSRRSITVCTPLNTISGQPEAADGWKYLSERGLTCREVSTRQFFVKNDFHQRITR
jgi:hypothetical protein